jgi:hypothetical protein
MKKLAVVAFGLLVLAVVAAPAAQAQSQWAASLTSSQEVPPILSVASGTFNATLTATDLTYSLTFAGTRGTVTQAHIHFAQPGVNGGIMVFLCSNLGNGPVGTQACPASGTIQGTINAASVGAGAASQGVPAGNFFAVDRAVRQKTAYVNIHTDLFPGGEIRGVVLKKP